LKFYRYAIETAQTIESSFSSANIAVKEVVSQQIIDIAEQISDLEDQQPVRILLVDDSGIVEYDSNNDLGPNAFLKRNLGKDYNIITRVLSGEDVQPMDLSIRTGSPTEKQWVMYAYAPINNAEVGNIGMVIISTSLSDVEQLLQAVTAQFMIYTSVAATIALLVGIMLSSTITKPIGRLTNVIKNMAQGKFNQRVSISGAKELRDLGKSFNTMSEKLEHLDRSRTEFVSNASHELKTPLSAVKVLSESLIHAQNVDVETYHEFLCDINQEVDRLSLIVQDLLSLVQLDDVENTKQYTKVNVTDIVMRVSKSLALLAKKKNIELIIETDDNCIIKGNELEVDRAVGNLIDNAIKYTQATGTVRATVKQLPDLIKLTVADNGPGIDNKHLPFIFDRFYRVDKARSREYGGTGLGLSITRQIIRKHNGYIEVESEVGKGTTFNIMLPRA
jgi:signal transduction histidine kinase